MRRPARIVLRFIALAAPVAALAVLFATGPGPSGPYVSALSNVGLGSLIQAAPRCHSRCNSLAQTCVAAHCGQPNCGIRCAIVGSTCSTVVCP